ncbi:MAG: acyltransferase [Caulobacter sp.]|nr:acyltransferase [Caulobacter sp.]
MGEGGPRSGGSGSTLVALQHLRAVAVLAVIVFHACQWPHISLETAAAGVDLFFVISGVILWTVSRVHEPDPRRFFIRRLLRVAPLYWIVSLAVAALALAWPGLIPHAIPTWPHLLMSLGFIPHLDPEGRPFPLVAPGWSLVYEAYLYLVFALGLWIAPRRLAIFVTAVLVATFLYGARHDAAYFLLANLQLLEFAVGIWLAQLRQPPTADAAGGGAMMIVFGLILFVLLQALDVRPGNGRLLVWGGPAALMVWGALRLEASGRTPAWPILRRLGDASFSLYLCQVIAMPLVARLISPHQPWLFVPLAIGASVAAGLACYRFIERPLRRRTAPLAPAAA